MRPEPRPRPNTERPLVAKRMTIAAGIVCANGVVFGADTDESVGDMRRRVYKIPSMVAPPVMITGSCENGHLMDAAVERIFAKIESDKPKTAASFSAILQDVMLGLYRREFEAYPDKQSLGMKLLVAAKLFDEKKALAWSIDCSVVRRMSSPSEIVGYGGYVQYVADHLVRADMTIESAIVAMSQLIAVAKKRVQYVGGENYIHAIRDDGGVGMQNFSFSPHIEDLYEYFCLMGSGLLLATGDKTATAQEFDDLATQFIRNLKWKKARIDNG